MNDKEFEDFVYEIQVFGSVYSAHKLIAECQRLRKLVQCCPKDDDYDGNCRIHSGRVPLERIK